MKYSLKQLQAFLAVAQCGSTLAAAQELKISQPAVSSAVAGLESNMQTKLFYRWKKRLVITEKGRDILPLVRRLVENARELEQKVFGNVELVSGFLRLGASRTFASYVLPHILTDFASQHPAVKIEVVSRNKTDILAQVQDLSLDLGVIAGAAGTEEIKCQPWFADELCVICAPDHQLTRKKNITAEDLAQNKWILRERGSGTREVLYAFLTERNQAVEIVMTLDNLEAIKQAVARMNVLSCVSTFSVQQELRDGQLAILPTPFLNLKRQYSFVVHREKEASQLLSYFIHHCTEPTPETFDVHGRENKISLQNPIRSGTR